MGLYYLSITYPLKGYLANLSIGLESIIIFIYLTMAALLMVRFIRNKKSHRDFRNLSWSFIFLGFGCAYFIYLYTDFITEDTNLRNQFSIISYLFIGFGWLVSIIINEYVEKIPKRPFSFFSIIIVVILVITVITKNKEMGYIALTIGLPLGILFLSYYSYRLYNLADRSQEVKRQIILFFFSVLILILGYFCISDLLMSIFGLGIRIVGDLLVILGLHFFKWAVDKLPDFSEFEWTHSLQSVVIVHSNGIPLFSRFWPSEGIEMELSKMDQDTMISAAISSIDTLLNEMVGSERLNRIELHDKVIIFEKRHDFMTFLIATTYLESLAIRMRQFTKEFEEMFSTILPTWGGNLSIFLPVEAIADKHFIEHL